MITKWEKIFFYKKNQMIKIFKIFSILQYYILVYKWKKFFILNSIRFHFVSIFIGNTGKLSK